MKLRDHFFGVGAHGAFVEMHVSSADQEDVHIHVIQLPGDQKIGCDDFNAFILNEIDKLGDGCSAIQENTLTVLN